MLDQLSDDERRILDSILLPLADQFEAGNRMFLIIKPDGPGEFESFAHSWRS